MWGRVTWVLLLALIPGVALADPKDDARRHFMAGLEAAAAGDYPTAIERFEAAQAAWPHPKTVYNIGRAYLDMGDYEQARAYFVLFRDSSAENAADADPILQIIEARLAATAPPAAAPEEAVAGAASSDDVARLRALADELAALAGRIGVAPEPEAAPAVAPPPDVALPELELLTDAYRQEVTTASRYGQEPLDSPSAVTVLSADDVRMSGARNVPDLLRRVVGLDVNSFASSQNEVSIRGFNRELSNKVLILVDGRSTAIDFLGTTFWPTLPINLADIERIEIIRGPGSAIYGANAVTGVINLITRTPGEGDAMHLTAEGGSPGIARVAASASGRVGVNAYRLSAGFEQEGRWATEGVASEGGSLVSQVPNQDLAQRKVALSGRVDRPIGDIGYIRAEGGYSEGTYEFYSLGALGDFFLDDRHHFVRGDVSIDPVHLRVFWNRDDLNTGRWLEAVDEPHSFDADGVADTIDAELEANGSLQTGAVRHRVSGGLGARTKRLTGLEYMNGFDPVEQHLAAFASEEASVGPLKAVASLRVDRHPLIPVTETLSPRAALIARVADRTSLRLTGGSAFRAPTMLESYMDVTVGTDADGVFIRDVGDVTLSPERIRTVELGAHDESSPFHTADVAVYYNRLTDIIALSDVVPSVAPFDPAENGYEAGVTGWTNSDVGYTGTGVEVDVELFPVDGVDLYTNLAYSIVLETSDAGTVRDLSSSPLKLNGGGTVRTPWRTDLSLAVAYASPQTWRTRDFDSDGTIVVTETELAPRVQLTSRIAVRPFADEQLELAFTGWNLLALAGAEREHPKGQPVAARLFFTSTYRF